MPKKQKRGLGVEGRSPRKDYRWRARTPGRKEAGRGIDPHGRTCASHSDAAVAGFGSEDSLSKCPMNPGKLAWEHRCRMDQGRFPGIQQLENVPLCLALQAQSWRNTLGWGTRPSNVSPWIRPVYVSLGLGPLPPLHHSQLYMDSSSF